MSTYDTLRKKYGFFTTPAYKLEIGGKEVARTAYIIQDITVQLDSGKTCGSCSYTVLDIYDHKTRTISPDALATFQIGKMISVSLGYGSDLTGVFFGYIEEVQFAYASGQLSLSVTALDARGLMRETEIKQVYREKTIQEIAKNVTQTYEKLMPKQKIDLDSKVKQTSITQEVDDLSFLLALAEMSECVLYMNNDTFCINKKESTVCVSFEWEDIEMSFSCHYCNTNFVGKGFDSRKGTEVTAKQKTKPPARQTELIPITRMVPLDAYLVGEAGTAAIQAMAKNEENHSVSGKLTCNGLPDITMGQQVEVKNFPLAALDLSNKMTVRGIKHSFTSDAGYTTQITLEG